MFSKNSKEQINSSSVVGESVLIEGNFDCLEDIIVYGKINGSIKTTEDVYIKEGSVINAEIKSKNLFLEGVVNGNIDCLEYVEISSTAKINGDISTKVINIEKGGVFNGKCVIKEDKKIEEVKEKKEESGGEVIVEETKQDKKKKSKI